MLTPPQLIYRGLKGSALTSLEFDHDFRSLRDFANALAAFLGILALAALGWWRESDREQEPMLQFVPDAGERR